jgi:hypothetical protein
MKVVINRCFGGFGLSHEAVMKYAAISGLEIIAVESTLAPTLIPYHYYIGSVNDENYWSEYSIDRSDPNLVKIVEQMGASASSRMADLSVVEIPDDVQWHISEYDGIEHVAENHRTWR